MKWISRKIANARVKIREKMNHYFAKSRQKKIDDINFTIISNNCWAGHVYRFFGLQYKTPTIGLFFYSNDFIKFCSNLKYYINQPIHFINIENSKYKNDYLSKQKKPCPIGKIGDIEIFFLHYKNEQDAEEKWNRRKMRINWDNIIIKNSFQNLCCEDDLIRFDNLPYEKKFVFVGDDCHIKSQVLWPNKDKNKVIPIDTIDFLKNINVYKLINGLEFRRK